MSNDTHSENHHEILERERELVLNRLVPVIEAIDRKRHAATDAVTEAVSNVSALAKVPDMSRTALVLVGAAVGGTVFALASWAARRRRERNRPLNQIVKALSNLAKPRRRSSRVLQTVTKAAGSLLLSAASEVAKTRLQNWLSGVGETDDASGMLDVLDVPNAPPDSPLAAPTLTPPGVSHAPPPIPINLRTS